MSDGIVSSVPWPTASPYPEPVDDGKAHLWGNKDGFSFHDILDTINPLQHLPVVGTIYRWITGDDTIGDLPRIAGDALYGGLWGAVSGLANVLVKEETGKDIGEQIVALVTGNSSTATQTPAIAANPSTASGATQATMPVTPPIPSAQTPTQTSAALVLPDHPPMPLFRGAIALDAAPVTQPATLPTTAGTAARTFLAQQAERQRQLNRGVLADGGRVLNSRPVPFIAPPGSLANIGRPRLMPVSATTLAPGGSNGPVDISQKMLGALDKYRALERQRNANGDGRGAQVDLTP